MRMESHLIWNRKPTENMHDYAMPLCIFKAILRGWSLNCYSHVQNLRTMSHGWLIHSIPRPKNETPTGFDTYLFSNINYADYAPGTLRPHMCCARVFFPPLLQESSKHTNQSIRPEQFSINWNRPKLPLHIQKYPGISGNKEYVNPHVSKNMHPIMPARNHPQNSGSHQVPNITQAQRICSLLPNLTPETTPKYLVYPIIPWHNIPQEHLLF